MKQIIYTNKQGYSETHIFDNSGSIVSVLNSDAYQQVSLSVTPEKTNEVVNYIAFAFVYAYNENEMTVDNAEVNISPLIQSSEDSKNETSEKEAVDEEVLSESIDKSKPYMQTSSEYDNTGNYVTSETNEQGSTTKYSYDTNGNPLSYRDGMSFEWENGRILKKINTSDKSVQMSYDSNGMRTQKSVDGVKTNYYYDSNKNLIALVKGNDTLLFYYDSDGSATSFSYNGTMYFYVKNLQGDVIRIIDLSGTEVASYVYDSWGNIKDTKGDPTVRELNPIRYRGYVYDTETSLYYLQSRYYDPFAGRFLNADAYYDTCNSVLSTNMFAYCESDPINYIDPYGYASYKNSYRYNKSSKTYNITTKINIMWTNLTYKYTIKNGVVKFSFEKNTYWSVLWRGGGKLLAEAIYKVAKSINKNYLKGRTIGGVNTEIQLHYIAFKLGIKKSSSKAADIGASYGNTGYDSNAWFFEGGNAAKIIAKFKISRIWAMASLIRNIVRYL